MFARSTVMPLKVSKATSAAWLIGKTVEDPSTSTCPEATTESGAIGAAFTALIIRLRAINAIIVDARVIVLVLDWFILLFLLLIFLLND
jgi:hypothetical protein